MVRLARSSYSIVRDGRTRRWYALPRAGGEPIRLDFLSPLLARAYERESGKVASAAARESVIEILEADDVPVVNVTAPEPTAAEQERSRLERLGALEREAAQLIDCDDLL